MSGINPKLLNVDNRSGNKTILLGEESGVFDTVNKNFPKIWSIYKEMKSLDWDENEFNYSSCNKDFKTCSKSVYDAMIKTLAFQWEADSVAAHAILPVMAPFLSSDEAYAAWSRITDNEIVHAATYSEIVRNSFDDPSVVLDEILNVSQAISRASVVSEVMSKAYKTSHRYAAGDVDNNQETYNDAFMFVVALLVLERIQFMSSFAVTFTICESGLFQPIGRAVQKIAQDEIEVHVKMDKEVLKWEMNTERGKVAMEQCRDRIKALIDEVVNQEFEWTDYLFSEGREIVGLNPSLLKQWVLFNARDVYKFMKVDSEHKLPTNNPLKFMENWLNIGKTQPSPQEEDVAQYRVGVLRRDDEGEEFELDF